MMPTGLVVLVILGFLVALVFIGYGLWGMGQAWRRKRRIRRRIRQTLERRQRERGHL